MIIRGAHSIVFVTTLVVVGLAAGGRATAAPGAEDLAPFPGARLSTSSLGEDVAHYEFVLGPVERAGGAIRVKRGVRASGRLDRFTYRIPDGFTPAEVAAHYRDQLAAAGFDVLFQCAARDCGKSTAWANSVFNEATLYGPDANQYYLAARRGAGAGERLAAVYVIERGNHRVYAHVELLATDAPSGLGEDGFFEALERDGAAELEEVVPNVDGELSVGAAEALRVTREHLNGSNAHGLYVVCHVYGERPPQELLEASRRCAEAARLGLDPDGTLELVAFGAGPFAPGRGEARNRVELVLPP